MCPFTRLLVRLRASVFTTLQYHSVAVLPVVMPQLCAKPKQVVTNSSDGLPQGLHFFNYYVHEPLCAGFFINHKFNLMRMKILLALLLGVLVASTVGQQEAPAPPALAIPAVCPTVPGFTFQPLQLGIGSVLASGLAGLNATADVLQLAAACNLDANNKRDEPPYVARCNAFTTTGLLLAVSIRPRFDAMPGRCCRRRARTTGRVAPFCANAVWVQCCATH